MKFKYFPILFLAVGASLGGITFGDTLGNGEKTENIWFSKDIPEASFVLETGEYQGDIYELVSSIDQFSTIEDLFQKSQLSLRNNRKELRKSLQEIGEAQENLEKSIEEKNIEKNTMDDEIQFLEKEIDLLKKRQEETKAYLRKILVKKYTLLMEEKHISLYNIFIERVSDAQMREGQTINLIEDTAKQLLEKQQGIAESLSQLQKTIENTVRKKETILSRLASYNEELEATKETKKEMLANTLKEQSLQKRIEKIATKKKQVDAKIESKFGEYEKIIAEKMRLYNCDGGANHPICTWISGYIKAEKDLISRNVILTGWKWPLSPLTGFGYHFRDQSYFTQNNIHHTGLDILTEPGKSIRSMEKGYILMKQYPSGDFPGIIIVKHPGNLISVYVGVVPTSKNTFTKVNAGDIIATSREYMDHSGKNNFHLELYENGKQIDPLENLDMSELSANIIPTRYGWKYVDDLKKAKQNVDMSEIQKKIGFFYVPGESELERQTNLLKTYADEKFQDPTLWIEESIAESIDPTFVLCVGFAESTLGKNLTTDGNIGNVGNTDEGERQSFDDSRSGVRAISSVVNNAWLGSYTTVDELSGWGNSSGPIYASSRTNWHENIVKCMSALKGKYVGNTANFRLSRAALLIYEQQGFSKKDTPTKGI